MWWQWWIVTVPRFDGKTLSPCIHNAVRRLHSYVHFCGICLSFSCISQPSTQYKYLYFSETRGVILDRLHNTYIVITICGNVPNISDCVYNVICGHLSNICTLQMSVVFAIIMIILACYCRKKRHINLVYLQKSLSEKSLSF